MAKKEAKSNEKKAKGAKKLRYWEGNVPDQFAFFVSDGKVVKNLKELVKALGEISEDAFRHHANKEKNDFSNWIKDVMSYNDLAGNILGKNRQATKETILLYVKKKTGSNA